MEFTVGKSRNYLYSQEHVIHWVFSSHLSHQSSLHKHFTISFDKV